MNNMISIASGFQYSINIGYDLNNDEKIKNFIPTKSALDLLEDILMSTNHSSSDRARVLIGAYGKGKSHIVLMILSMLLKKDLNLFKRTIDKAKDRPRLLQLVTNYYESNERILPVIISGSSTSLTQAFLLALQRTLSQYNMLDVMPETNYRAAVNVIKRWEKDFPETYDNLQRMLDEPIPEFLSKLENYDVIAYETFEKIYPSLTAGSVFNPFLGFDVVELYESAAKGLHSKGFTGIYVVYDEFSKYLETSIANASVSDTKMLQDFAEKCSRSANLQMHLLLISHKEIANYIDKLPKQKVDGWRGVSERFKHIHMSNNFSQTYEIISTVIQKDKRIWEDFCKTHDGEFGRLVNRYGKHPMYYDASDEQNTAIKGCYPLHPVSTFILPRLSEKVAQNERTLFTFLSSDGVYTLPAFLDKEGDDSFALITPDLIYDYFAPLLKKEAYSSTIHSLYVLTDTILNKLVHDSLESKIVKSLSLIYMLEQFERLKPTQEEIVGIYLQTYDVDEINNAINSLIADEYVVYLKRSNNYLRLKQTSGVDIQQQIRDCVESQKGRVVIKEALNSSNFDSYMYPARYNDENEMVRYFSFEFISGAEVTLETDWEKKSQSISADGVIYGIIPSDESDIERLESTIKNSSLGCTRCIFVLPKHYRNIDDVVQEFQAVSMLRDRAADDEVVFEEYEVIFEDLSEIIASYICEFTRPEKYASTYIYNGKVQRIRRKAALTELMSSICDDVYSLTPIINNEAVNKNVITGIATKSRKKIVTGLLRGNLEEKLGLAGTGQDVSIMRSTLVRTGIWDDNGDVPTINLRPSDKKMCHLLKTIEGFITEARQKGVINFAILYDRLTSPNYHIGLRSGLIPIYLAAVIHEYRQQIVIVDQSGQVPLNADTLAQINASPSNYSVEYLDWNSDKELYVARLAEIFSDNVIEAEKVGNAYDYVANAMKRWYMSLPKYSKESRIRPDGRKIVRRQLEMIRLLRLNTASSDLLFKRIPKAFDYDSDFTADVAEEILNTKQLFDGLLNELKEWLSKQLKELFRKPGSDSIGNRVSLVSILTEWCESLNASVFEQLFPDGTERFLDLIMCMTNDEDLFISKVAKLATDLRIEDWDNDTKTLFLDSIKKYKKTAETFHSNAIAETINETSAYQLMFTDADGATTTRRFDKVDISSRGKLLFNQVTSAIDSMGQAITEQEKRQILMEILKKMC